MKRRFNPIPPLWLVSAALLAAAIVLCIRSRWHADVFAFFPPSARLQGVASERHGVLLFFSDVQFSPEYAWSVDADSLPADDFADVHRALLEDASRPRHFARFAFARDQLSLPPRAWSFNQAYTYAAILLPWWGLFAVIGLLPCFGSLLAFKRRRRRRRGLCLGCGYDLRGSTIRCPECGRPFGQSGGMDPQVEADGIPALGSIRIDWISRVLLVLIVVTIIVLTRTYLSRWRSTIFERRDHLAGLDRRVQDIVFLGMPLDQALDVLGRQTGTRLVRSTTMQIPQQGVHASHDKVGWNSPIWADFRDVSLAQALDVLTREAQFEFPLSFESRADGTVFLDTEDEMIQYLRIYDTRAVYGFLSPKPDTIWPYYPNTPDEQLSEIATETELDRFPERSGDYFSWGMCVDGRMIFLRSHRWHQKLQRAFDKVSAIHEPWPKGAAIWLHTAMEIDQWAQPATPEGSK